MLQITPHINTYTSSPFISDISVLLLGINAGFNRSMQRKTAMVNLKKNLHKIIVWPRSIIEVYRFNNIEVFVTYL